jgi:outer membrane receptor protein involved in Fe transport
MGIRKTWVVGVMAAAMALVSLAALGQTTMATLRGTVHDEQGGALPGVTMTARQAETNTTRTTVTNESGQFFLPTLPPGTWALQVELSGFNMLKQENIRLGVGQEISLDLTLKIGGVQETVVVSGKTALVETQSGLGTMVDTKDIDELPTIARDFSSLAKMAPGTTEATAGTNAGTGVSFGGQRQFSNNVLVDGASNLFQFYGKQANNFPQDWIQEFQVMTNSFSAEFGQASGGVMNVITRSGSNKLIGRAYGFLRDNKLDSPPFAGKVTVDSSGAFQPVFLSSTPNFTQNRLGVYAGGPIVKDKVFFFGGFENLKNDTTIVLGITDYWVKQGVATQLPGGHREKNYMIKPDINLGTNHRLSFRYSQSPWKDLNLSLNNTPLDTLDPRETFSGPLWSAMANLTSTLSNKTFNEVRVYYNDNEPFITCNMANAGGGALIASAPRPGAFSGKTYPGANFGCGGFTGLEGEANLFLIDNFSFIVGKHQFKVGGQLAFQKLLMDVEEAHIGKWVFDKDVAFDINNPASYPYSFSGNIGSTVDKEGKLNPSVFIQDTWQLRSNLTLNLGLRYDVDRTLLVGNNYVDAKNQRIVARYGGAPPLQKTNLDLNNVAPRFGFVWVPTQDRRTTVRASGGLFYEQNHYNFTDIYLNNTLLSDRRISFTDNDPGTNPFWNAADPAGSKVAMRAWLASFYPYYPDLSMAAMNKEILQGLDPNIKVPYTAQFSGGFTHSFPWGLDLQVDYVHTRGYDMIIGGNRNWQQVNGQWVVLDPRFTSVNLYWNAGWTRYHGLETRTEFRRGPARVGLSYTLSKTTSNTSAGITGITSTNPFDLGIDVGPDNADRRHNAVVNVSYLFPFDFQVAAIGIYRSATPWSVTSTAIATAGPFGYRLEPRNSRRGDSLSTLDLRLGKTFKFGRYGVAAFWEMFNALNTVNYTNYQGSKQSSVFGQPRAAFDMRRQQVGFRFDF